MGKKEDKIGSVKKVNGISHVDITRTISWKRAGMEINIVYIFIILFLILVTEIKAQSSTSRAFDVEIDPIAYIANGFSVHGGYLTGAWRYDVGIFGLELPEWVHGNEEFTASFIGAGWKIDRFLKGIPDGLFVGAEGGLIRLDVTHKPSELERDRIQYSLGVRGGYRWNTGLGNLYVTPWLGLGFTLNAEDITINGDTFDI
ncbi:MAG: hypothetical protein WD267_11105 [Balneolales bacterium]